VKGVCRGARLAKKRKSLSRQTRTQDKGAKEKETVILSKGEGKKKKDVARGGGKGTVITKGTNPRKKKKVL